MDSASEPGRSRVAGQLIEVDLGLLDRADLGAGQRPQRIHQHRNTLAAFEIRTVAIVLKAFARGDEESRGVLGALGVAAHPEQVCQHTRRTDDIDLRGLERRQTLHRETDVDGLRTRRPIGDPHPHVLRGVVMQAHPVGRVLQHLTQSPDHRGVSGALRDRERPEPDRRGDERRTIGCGRRVRVFGGLLPHPLPALGAHPLGEVAALRRGQQTAVDDRSAGGGSDQQLIEFDQQVRALGRVAAPVSRSAVELQILVEQRPRERR